LRTLPVGAMSEDTKADVTLILVVSKSVIYHNKANIIRIFFSV
jgi:hypothetical protein